MVPSCNVPKRLLCAIPDGQRHNFTVHHGNRRFRRQPRFSVADVGALFQFGVRAKLPTGILPGHSVNPIDLAAPPAQMMPMASSIFVLKNC